MGEEMNHRALRDGTLAMVDPRSGYRLSMGFKVDEGYLHAYRWNFRTMADGNRLDANCNGGIARYGTDHLSIGVVLRPEA
jgi:hypothetical protein